jgi:hypothetical protein
MRSSFWVVLGYGETKPEPGTKKNPPVAGGVFLANWPSLKNFLGVRSTDFRRASGTVLFEFAGKKTFNDPPTGVRDGAPAAALGTQNMQSGNENQPQIASARGRHRLQGAR